MGRATGSELADAEFGPAGDDPGHGPAVGLDAGHPLAVRGGDELEGVVRAAAPADGASYVWVRPPSAGG